MRCHLVRRASQLLPARLPEGAPLLGAAPFLSSALLPSAPAAVRHLHATPHPHRGRRTRSQMSPPSPFVFGEASSERPPPASFTAPRRRRGAYDRADGLPVHTKGRAAGGKGPGLSPTRTAEVYEALMGREEEAAVVAVTTSTAPASGPEAAAAAAAAAGRARWTATVTAVATDAAASGRSVAGELRAVLDEAAAAAAAAAGAHPPPNADDTYPSCPPSHTAVVLPPTVRVAAATAAARVGDAPAAAAALLHNVPPRAGSGVFPHVAASILASAHLRAGRPRRALDMHLGPGGTDFGAIPATADAAVWGQVVTAAAVGGWWAEARRALRLARARGVRGLAERVYAVTLLPRPPGGGGSVGGEAAWALDLTAMMAADGVTPSTRTTVAVVSAVARGGDADAAERVAADAGLDALLAAAAEDAPPAREIGDAAVTREALYAAERGGSDAAVRTPPAAATDEVQRVAVALLAIAAARRDTPAATAIWDRLVAAVGTPNAHAAAAYVRALAHGVVPSWVASPPPPPPPAADGAPPLPPPPPSAAAAAAAAADAAAAVTAATAVVGAFPAPPPPALADKYVALLARSGSPPAATAAVLPRLYAGGAPSAAALTALLWAAVAGGGGGGGGGGGAAAAAPASRLSAPDVAAVRAWAAAAADALPAAGGPALLCAAAGALAAAAADAPAAVALLVAHSRVGAGAAGAGAAAAATAAAAGAPPLAGGVGAFPARRWAALLQTLPTAMSSPPPTPAAPSPPAAAPAGAPAAAAAAAPPCVTPSMAVPAAAASTTADASPSPSSPLPLPLPPRLPPLPPPPPDSDPDPDADDAADDSGPELVPDSDPDPEASSSAP
ncbi:hypothetical protein I4F81_007407 [Pyropia yezoensis]|uniref:Uncharacterized protein n=1 Tax=Pyropia yezoensis TaxID=2788 RepID=A0ACC3C3J4_PYRYE|nr:hypothetical protein I4F81_007407 [Neopyropia yezoensis]